MTIKPEEDNRNGFIALLLQVNGFRVKDQTRWSRSAVGVQAGEIDIKVDNPNGTTEAIIEAFNLTGLNRKVISTHITMLQNHYDCSGLPRNYVLVYVTTPKFGELWEKYKTYVKALGYKYPLENGPEENITNYAGIRMATTTHDRDGIPVELVHIFIDMGNA